MASRVRLGKDGQQQETLSVCKDVNCCLYLLADTKDVINIEKHPKGPSQTVTYSDGWANCATLLSCFSAVVQADSTWNSKCMLWSLSAAASSTTVLHVGLVPTNFTKHKHTDFAVLMVF